MSNEKNYDPFLGLNQMSEMWDKQITGLLYNLANNNEFVRTASNGLNTYSMYLEKVRKNQEIFASLMNIPTKKDIANAAKLSIQTEEKIDRIEEQVWKLQDSVGSITKVNGEMFEEVINMVMQMKNEFQKIAQEVTETKKIREDLQELRKEIDRGISGLVREKTKKESEKKQDKELVLSGSNK
jgi:hypothetical protein